MLKDVLPRDSTERKTWNEKPVSPASAWGGRHTVKPLWIWGVVFLLFFSTDDEWNNSFQSRRGSDKSRTNDSG